MVYVSLRQQNELLSWDQPAFYIIKLISIDTYRIETETYIHQTLQIEEFQHRQNK